MYKQECKIKVMNLYMIQQSLRSQDVIQPSDAQSPGRISHSMSMLHPEKGPRLQCA